MTPTEPELPLFAQWFDFLKWLLATTEKFPKRLRFTLTERIDNLALDVIEELVEARYTRHKAEQLQAVNRKLERLRVLLRLAHEVAVLPHRGYEYASRSVDEAGRMVGGWIKQQQERT